jgi:hypothetical protein
MVHWWVLVHCGPVCEPTLSEIGNQYGDIPPCMHNHVLMCNISNALLPFYHSQQHIILFYNHGPHTYHPQYTPPLILHNSFARVKKKVLS